MIEFIINNYGGLLVAGEEVSGALKNMKLGRQDLVTFKSNFIESKKSFDSTIYIKKLCKVYQLSIHL